jgi:putative transposase
MKRRIIFETGNYYHISNHGINLKTIFKSAADKDRFSTLLHIANNKRSVVWRTVNNCQRSTLDSKETLVDIGAYCLLPDHFHLLIKEGKAGNISLFMKKVLTGYSMYFNKKYKRTGPLFRGRFKAEKVESEEYLKYLFSYIHMNPLKIFTPAWRALSDDIREGVERHLIDYRYSSYGEYLEIRPCSGILHKDVFPESLRMINTFDDFLKEWAGFNEWEGVRIEEDNDPTWNFSLGPSSVKFEKPRVASYDTDRYW